MAGMLQSQQVCAGANALSLGTRMPIRIRNGGLDRTRAHIAACEQAGMEIEEVLVICWTC